jgi:hypothetical protein
MTYEFVPFGSTQYFYYLAALLFARGMDLLSTWVVMPTLVGEVNPISKRLGWRGGILSSVIFSAVVAAWPLPAIIVSVVSVLVAARNFQAGSNLMLDRPRLFAFCVAAQSGLFAVVGGAVMVFSETWSEVFAIGLGIVVFGAANLFFNMLSWWRNRGG